MIVFEIVIGVFAGYCCAYFLTTKFLNMTPEQLILEYLEKAKEVLKDEKA